MGLRRTMMNIRISKAFVWILPFLLILAYLGCASPHMHDGLVSFIQPSVTTRSEVIEGLGEPLWQQDGGVAYLWDSSPGWYPRHRRNRDYVGYRPHRGRRPVNHEYEVFCVAFDSQDRVSRREFLDDDESETDEAVVAWFRAHVPAEVKGKSK